MFWVVVPPGVKVSVPENALATSEALIEPSRSQSTEMFATLVPVLVTTKVTLVVPTFPSLVATGSLMVRVGVPAG